MIVVSDTSVICYLILIEAINLLPQIYGRIIIPEAVFSELSSPEAPNEVRCWLQEKPEWLDIQQAELSSDNALQRLDIGEREAISLAEVLSADVILIDEKAARKVAIEKKLNVVGLLGVLGVATDRSLIEFQPAIERLQKTNMRLSPKLIRQLSSRYI